MRPLLFLDIDGVLNGHEFCEAAQSCTLRNDCVHELNRIISATDCHLVITSAWRYMVHNGAMTRDGFEYLLRTHGVAAKDRIHGFTCLDEDPIYGDRGRQIAGYLGRWDAMDNPCYCAIDDADLGIKDQNISFVQTNGHRGLTRKDADKVIEILNGGAR